MKKRKKLLVFRTLALSVSSALLLSAFPAYAAPEEPLTSPLSAQDAVLPIETPAYSFLFQYDDAANKSILLDKILEIGGEVQYEIDSMNCVAAKLTMEQLPRIKEMECVQMIEKNYEYNLLTLNEETNSSSAHESICENEPLIPEETTEPESPSTDTNISSAETSDEAVEPNEETEVQADPIEELRRLLAGEPPVREESSVSPSYELLLPEESAGDEQTAVGAHAAFQAAHALNYKGQNRKIALFDTGVSAHPDLQIAGGVSFTGDPNAYNDTNGHGTQMAGIIAASGAGNPLVKGAAPEAQLYAVKLTEGESFINTAAVLKGIEWAIAEDMDIISMSFGTYFYSKLLESALELAQENGILVVAPAGNDGGFAEEYRLMYPAAYDAVIAVGAGGAYGTESFSNNNEQLDFVAPGRLDTLQTDGAYTRVVGTSASAAYVTGILAGLWSHNIALSGDKLLNLTKNTAYVSNNQKSYVGYGEINVAEALQSAEDNAILNSVTAEKLVKNNMVVLEELELKEEAALADVNTEMPAAMAAGNCFANEMANALPIALEQWKYHAINCPGNEIWYKFQTDFILAHQNLGSGKYIITTNGSSDTLGEIYDSSGNKLFSNDDNCGNLNFCINATNLLYDRTYYVRVRLYGSNTGNYGIIVKPLKYSDVNSDFVANTFSNAANLSAGIISWGNYNRSYDSVIEYWNDVDYFKYTAPDHMLVEIYTDGSTDTVGTLYEGTSCKITSNDDGGMNYNFKITAYLVKGRTYYIEVRHSSIGGTGAYVLKLKFLKQTLKCSLAPNGATWINDEYDKDVPENSTTNFTFMNRNDSEIWGEKVQEESFRNTIKTLCNQSAQELAEFLLTYGFSTSFAYSAFGFILNFVEVLSENLEIEAFNIAYNDYKNSDYSGYILLQGWTVKVSTVWPLPIYNYPHKQTYAHYNNTTHYEGINYLYGHWVY